MILDFSNFLFCSPTNSIKFIYFQSIFIPNSWQLIIPNPRILLALLGKVCFTTKTKSGSPIKFPWRCRSKLHIIITQIGNFGIWLVLIISKSFLLREFYICIIINNRLPCILFTTPVYLKRIWCYTKSTIN